mgnify:CR=1 FL=1
MPDFNLTMEDFEDSVQFLVSLEEVDIEGERTRLTAYDSTYIAAGKEHYFLNVGDEPMVILWIYGSDHVTRTFSGSDVEVSHLTDEDSMAPR